MNTTTIRPSAPLPASGTEEYVSPRERELIAEMRTLIEQFTLQVVAIGARLAALEITRPQPDSEHEISALSARERAARLGLHVAH